MEGRTRIVLIEPGAESQDTFGDVSSTPVQHSRSALRTDRGGRRGEVLDTSVGEYEREYELRDVGLAVTNAWLLQDIDDGGRTFAIESVVRPASRQRKLILRAKSRS